MERLQNIKMQILKSGCSESAHKILADQMFYLFIWRCETTEGFSDSHFDVKFSNVFSVAMGLTIFLLLGVALPLFKQTTSYPITKRLHFIMSQFCCCSVMNTACLRSNPNSIVKITCFPSYFCA